MTTRGFRDALEIGYQARPNIFALNIVKPEQLYAGVVEIDERVLADGTVEPRRISTTRAAAAQARAEGFAAFAIVFMHGYRYPAHERVVAGSRARWASRRSPSATNVRALIKLVGRGDTTVVDAYLSPILARYARPRRAALDVERTGARLMFMMSSGGLDRSRAVRRARTRSSPARPAASSRWRAPRESAGFDQVIGFDMGGTSTDVAHYDGAFERAFETEVAGVRMRAPMMSIHTVAAGGGSILAFRRRAVPRRAGFGGRRSRPEVLPPRRPARRHRRQSDGRQAHARILPQDLRPGRRTSRSTPTPCAQASPRWRTKIGDGRTPRGVADGFIAIAVGQHGRCDQEDLGRARLRRHALCAQLLRRRRRPARLRRRRRARHRDAC